MGYGRRWIGLLTGILAALILLFWLQEPNPKGNFAARASVPFTVEVTAQGHTERVDCWRRDDGQYFVFLPAYARLSEARIYLQDQKEIYVDHVPVQNGQSCDGFQPGQAYSMTFSANSTNRERTVTFLCSRNLPSLYIDVQSGNMDYIHEEKGNEESGRIRLLSPEGTVDFSGNLNSIRGRGNYTWTKEKKPYSLTLTAEANLLGMGAAREWILLSNPVDPSLLRNKLVFDYAAEAEMPYSPESRWVDLYLNGSYAGVYQLSERNEVHSQRVALEETDSFLVSMEAGSRLLQQGYPHVSTQRLTFLRIHHSALEEEQLQALWQSAENAVFAEDGIDPITGKSWTELIDLDSWARKYLIEEIFGSVDAGAISQYYYGTISDGKICAGPVWDYDVALGNTKAWQLSRPEAFFANRAKQNLWMGETWYYALYQKEAFYDRVVTLYREEFRPLLSNWLADNLEAYALQLEPAARLNTYRWQTLPFREEIRYLQSYMEARLAFLDSVWLEGETWYTVLVDLAEGSNTACYAVRPGDPMPQLRNIADIEDAVGWYHRDTNEPVDLTAPVDRNLDIYLKYLEEAPEEPQKDVTVLMVLVPMTILAGILLGSIFFDIRRRKASTTERQKVSR